MQTIAKITPADYPDLLAAVDTGMSQRELARRYDCAPSLIARHVARAKRAREPSDLTREPDLDLNAEPKTGSLREILEARIRDPKVSARDLASLTNALVKLDEDLATAQDSMEETILFPFMGEPGARVIRVYVSPVDDSILGREEWPAAEAPPDEELLQPPTGYELAPRPKRNLDGSIKRL